MRLTAVAPLARWKLRPAPGPAAEAVARPLGLRPLTATLLWQRGIQDPESARAVLEPSLRELPDPRELPHFDRALAALDRAREAGHKVLIHGDYDVDGTCGAVVLHRLCQRLGLDSQVFLPDRLRDGYSFGAGSLAAIRAADARLILAVDNGTTAHGPLAELAAEGREVVVVDHHLPGETLPEAAALLNPWLGEEDGLFPHFCGAGVAWLFAWGALRHVLGEDKLPESDRRFLMDSLGLVAIATVGDVMPLRGPNRALVRHGLATLATNGQPGLRALHDAAKLRGPAQASDVAFRLAPRLNAAGRLFQADKAFRLLAADRADEAQALCEELEEMNLERRRIQERELARLQPQVQMQMEQGAQAIVAGSEEAHFGVLGIVASQVSERTGLPTLLWAGCEGGVARGSARAPEGCHLVQLLDQVAGTLDGYGGHARAAGFHFDPRQAEALRDGLHQAAAALPKPPPPLMEVDAEIGPGEVDAATVDEFTRLEPFGEGFPAPLFLASGLTLAADPRAIGDGSHAELRLQRDGEVVRCLAWRQAERLRPLAAGDRVDVVVSVGINAWRGRRDVEWTLHDLRPSP
ncbi:MAG: single-stranded-DNA-specific exonuclease RecJ [Planctomycetota bacterium]